MALFAAAILPSGHANPSAMPAVDAVATTNAAQAVRLRKLHLVRPDLINYPLSFEVVC